MSEQQDNVMISEVEDFVKNYKNGFSELQNDLHKPEKLIEIYADHLYVYAPQLLDNIEKHAQDFLQINDFKELIVSMRKKENVFVYNKVLVVCIFSLFELNMKKNQFSNEALYIWGLLNTYSIKNFGKGAIRESDWLLSLYAKVSLSLPSQLYRDTEAFQAFNDWETYIADKQKNIDKIQEEIERQEKILQGHKSSYNFVALNKAFERIYDNKVIELESTQRNMKKLGWALVLAPLVLLLFLTVFYGMEISSQGIKINRIPDLTEVLPLSMPVLTIEIFLLYFFRLAVKSFFSIKAQMLQLDLRQSLCAFFEGYTDFREGLSPELRKSDNENHLDKFESLIFSGISMDEGKVPTTFDGLSDLANIAKQLRGK